ncbi:MAG: sigma 54-interacting transcriptional regulator [Deltaproteobacteria bacterium]|nr:sigma 54-interacting transcriptional regulator [Deltaproteobacteria bacterium]
MKNRGNRTKTSRECKAEILGRRAQADKICNRLEDYLDDLLDASFDGIVISDAKGNVLKANRAYLKLSAIAREEIVGHNLGDMVKDHVLKGAVVFEVTKTRVPTTKIHTYERTGKVAMVTGSPVFDDRGTLIYVVANFRDVTQLRKLSENLGRSFDPFGYSEKESFHLKPDLAELPDYGILVRNQKMKTCLDYALRVARFNTPVLILGETGVGKTKLAQIIHKASTRSRMPFISINCASIPENLLESELFGYEKGAFTGANVQGKTGQFELASGGTLVLEEIGDLSFPLQVKLLQAIEENRILKIGGKNALEVDIRLIAVTNRDLKKMVTQGQFRSDLYFRLNVVPITVPALRERSDEIPLLVQYFFSKFNGQYGTTKYPGYSLLRVLCQYEYPGNVRELKNLVERLVIMAPEDNVKEEHLELLACDERRFSALSLDETQSLDCFLRECEKRLITRVTREEPTLKQAAQRLAISVTTLWRKMEKHGLQKAPIG